MKFYYLDDARTMYGMVNSAAFDEEGKYTVKRSGCRFCGQAASMHVLHSTLGDSEGASGTFQLTNDLYDKLEEKLLAKNNSKFKSPKEKMIGVLKCKGSAKIFASHSGKFEDPLFRGACEELGYEYSVMFNPGSVKNRNHSIVRSDKIQTFDYQCAAPKLIQDAIRQACFPMEMTEMCFKGTTPRRVAGSCGRCMQTIPAMLCPANIDSQRIRNLRTVVPSGS